MSDISNAAQERIPVTVLTGFLGSGKTTVLAHLLKNPSLSKTAIVVNEFGEVGLDHDLLEHSSEDFILLANGCVCCTVRGDLVAALAKIDRQRALGPQFMFERVIIETTGLADPAPILHTIMSDPQVTDHYRLDQVIATVDAVNGMSTLDRHVESIKQIAVADRILLTKKDLATPAGGEAIRRRLALLNPAAAIVEVTNGNVDPAEFYGDKFFNPLDKTPQVQDWLQLEAYEENRDTDSHADAAHAHAHAHSVDLNRHDDHIRSYSVIRDEPISHDSFTAWLNMISSMRGDDLLRVKGIVNVIEHPSRPIVIHGVQHVFHPPVFLDKWPSDDHRTRLVFITRDIDKDDIEATLEIFESRRAIRHKK